MNQTSKSALRGLMTTGALAFAVFATSSVAHAAGFAIYETSARGFAMANANVGRNDDASALYSNPAASTQLEGTQVLVGSAFISPSIDVTTTFGTTTTTTSMNSYTQAVPYLYATHRFGENFTVGLSTYVPYGLKSDFPMDWAGRYNNYLTDIKTIQISPSIAYRLIHDQIWAKQISISAGWQVLRTDVDMRRMLMIAPGVSTPFILKGDTWNYDGYNFSLQWEINDKWALGVVYRSGYKVKVDGDAQLAPVQIGGNTVFPGRSGPAWGEIDLPESWSFGLNFMPIPPLNIGIQALRTNWSSYDELVINAFNSPTNTVSEKKWSDVWRYSIGAEYQISNPITLRAGFVIDKDPVNPAYAEYMVPSNDRQIYTIGLGWRISKLVTVDLAYGYLTIKSREFTNPNHITGVADLTLMHTGHAHIGSVSLNFRF